MAILGTHGTFLIDRKLLVLRVNGLTFRQRKMPKQLVTGTLVDGEYTEHPEVRAGRAPVPALAPNRRASGFSSCTTSSP